jgi:hypothetical protein
MFPRLVTFAVSVSIVVFATGCDPTPPVKTVHVAGTITFKGQPVSGADVSFMNASASGKSAGGKTDTQGRFVLKTIVAGNKMQDGAPPGEYKVTVEKKGASGAATGALQGPNVDPTTLSAEEKQKMMEEAQSKQRSTQLATDQTKVGQQSGSTSPELPASYADVTKTELRATVKESGTNDFTFELVGD